MISINVQFLVTIINIFLNASDAPKEARQAICIVLNRTDKMKSHSTLVQLSYIVTKGTDRKSWLLPHKNTLTKGQSQSSALKRAVMIQTELPSFFSFANKWVRPECTTMCIYSITLQTKSLSLQTSKTGFPCKKILRIIQATNTSLTRTDMK